jgi:hypothetical protein
LLPASIARALVAPALALRLLRSRALLLSSTPRILHAGAIGTSAFALTALARLLLHRDSAAREVLGHDPRGFGVALRLERVVLAVRTDSPPFRVRPPALRTENAFRQRHFDAALYTSVSAAPGCWKAARRCGILGLPPMIRDRKKTLEVLIELAEQNRTGSCWSENRAEDLLRSQSSPEELRELGAAPELIASLWPESK